MRVLDKMVQFPFLHRPVAPRGAGVVIVPVNRALSGLLIVEGLLIVSGSAVSWSIENRSAYAARIAFWENVACVIDTVVP